MNLTPTEWERAQQVAADLVFHADPTTSCDRWDPEFECGVQLTRIGEFLDDPEELRPILAALLDRLIREYADASEEFRTRTVTELRERFHGSSVAFTERGRLIGAATVITAIKSPHHPGPEIADGLLARRLIATAQAAVRAILDAHGREQERRLTGLGRDPYAILAGHDTPHPLPEV